MKKVSNSGPLGDAKVEASLVRLRAEHEDWAVQHMPLPGLPWEAFRHPERHPVAGCVGWLRAESAERLDAMISAAERMEAELDTGPDEGGQGGEDGR